MIGPGIEVSAFLSAWDRDIHDTVNIVHAIDLKSESASLATQNIEVELIPLASRCELGSRKSREWVKIQSI